MMGLDEVHEFQARGIESPKARVEPFVKVSLSEKMKLRGYSHQRISQAGRFYESISNTYHTLWNRLLEDRN